MQAARGFSKDIGNYMSLGIGTVGALLNGAGVVSIHSFALFNTLTSGSTANRVFGITINGTGASGISFGVDGASQFLRASVRSVLTDSAQAAGAAGKRKVSYGTWTSLGLVIDFANDIIYLYVDGKFDSQTTVTFANASYTQGAAVTGDAIGSNITVPTTPDAQTDGKIAQLGIWTSFLGPRDFARLASGVPATNIQRPPIIYMKLQGVASPEYCSVGSGIVGTVTGVIPVVSGPPGNLSFLQGAESI